MSRSKMPGGSLISTQDSDGQRALSTGETKQAFAPAVQPPTQPTFRLFPELKHLHLALSCPTHPGAWAVRTNTAFEVPVFHPPSRTRVPLLAIPMSSLHETFAWKRLGSHVTQYAPAISGDPVDYHASRQPAVYLLFGWMDARSEHIGKYASSVHAMYPSSTIITIECTTSFFYSSQLARNAALQPVANTLLEYAHQGRLSGIIVHCFSNGGCFQLMTLQQLLLRTEWPTDITPARCGLIFDSSPGNHGLRSALSSMAPRNPLLYLLVAPIVAIFYAFFVLRTIVTRRPPLFNELRTCLLSHDLPARITSHPSPRLYIYSATDKMVDAREVEAHVALSEAAGLQVTAVRYEKSPHVAHARTDGDRYWNSVKAFWADVCK